MPDRFFKGLWRKQVNLTAALLATSFALVGGLLLAIAMGITKDGGIRQVLIETGVSLTLFGGTTLVLTIVVSDSLDRNVEHTFSEIRVVSDSIQANSGSYSARVRGYACAL